MSTTINAARTRAHLSRHERQRLARAEAFSRRTTASPPATPAIQLQQGELELIEGLVRHNRTAVSSCAARDRRNRCWQREAASRARPGRRGGALGTGAGRDQRRSAARRSPATSAGSSKASKRPSPAERRSPGSGAVRPARVS